MRHILNIVLFALVKKRLSSSPPAQVFKGYSHCILWIFKGNFHAQSGSPEGEFDVLMREYAQNGGFREPLSPSPYVKTQSSQSNTVGFVQLGRV